MYSVIDGIRSRFYHIQVERNRQRELSNREGDDGFRALLDWERNLASAILCYLKVSHDRKRDWIRVKYELKRLELVAKDQVRSLRSFPSSFSQLKSSCRALRRSESLYFRKVLSLLLRTCWRESRSGKFRRV